MIVVSDPRVPDGSRRSSMAAASRRCRHCAPASARWSGQGPPASPFRATPRTPGTRSSRRAPSCRSCISSMPSSPSWRPRAAAGAARPARDRPRRSSRAVPRAPGGGGLPGAVARTCGHGRLRAAGDRRWSSGDPRRGGALLGRAIDHLPAAGAGRVLLACTELPLACAAAPHPPASMRPRRSPAAVSPGGAAGSRRRLLGRPRHHADPCRARSRSERCRTRTGRRGIRPRRAGAGRAPRPARSPSIRIR